MTNEDVDRAIEDAQKANTEIRNKDINGNVFQNNFETPKRGEEEKELELLSNLSSSAE